jgi:arylformamidase
VTAYWHDISAVLGPELPVWPGSPGIRTSLRLSIDRGDDANVTQVTLDVHTGTHVDAPNHFIPGGADVSDLGLEPFVGPALVVDTGTAVEISAAVLDSLRIPSGVERLLLRTANSRRAGAYRTAFDSSYAALTLDGAEWIVGRGFRLIGIDYLSVQRYDLTTDVHRALLGAAIPILEGVDLARVPPGGYRLVCLPLRLADAEAAPARAILLPLDPVPV